MLYEAHALIQGPKGLVAGEGADHYYYKVQISSSTQTLAAVNSHKSTNCDKYTSDEHVFRSTLPGVKGGGRSNM